VEFCEHCGAASNFVVDLSRVFCAVAPVALQDAHGCTHVPCGMLAVLPTHFDKKTKKNKTQSLFKSQLEAKK